MLSQPTQIQRAITVDFIGKRRLPIPIVWLKPETAIPTATGPTESLNTDINDWSDDRNLGARLTDGYIELAIKAPDDVWTKNLFEACKHLGVDARASYGPMGGPIGSILLHIDDPLTIDRWEDLWPRGHRNVSDQWVETKFTYSALPNARGSKPLWRESKPLPGSLYNGKLIVWRPLGRAPADDIGLGLEDLEYRQISATTMESVCRAIAFATLAYWIRAYLDGVDDWDESLTRAIGGWIARVAIEGHAINARGKSLEGVCWASVSDTETASNLVAFLQTHVGARGGLASAFMRAAGELERNSDAPIPGWGSLETLFGAKGKIGIRRAFRAGVDLDMVEKLSERYVYDIGQNVYRDRKSLLQGTPDTQKFDSLVHRYRNDMLFLAGKKKPLNPFELYASSKLRVDVGRSDMFPGQEPAAILRYSPVHGLVDDEERQPDEYRILNTYRGFTIKPIQTIDEGVMWAAISATDKMLGMLTQDNDAQIHWIKCFLAWTIQHPELKQQVCPIFIGGQGIGKSVFGYDFLNSLFGELAGAPAAFSPAENRFAITAFIGKLITFIDEVRLRDRASVDELKKIIRTIRLAGQEKYVNERQYDIYSRVILAANQPDIGLSAEDGADRAFFFMIGWTAENRRMLTTEFQKWCWSFKGFYREFIENLGKAVFRQHLMRYFVDLECTREALEDLTHSSSREEDVVKSTMSQARTVARYIVADARMTAHLDITALWDTGALAGAVQRVTRELHIRMVPTMQVMMEFERANVVDKIGEKLRFKYRYATLLKAIGEAHGLEIMPQHPIEQDDYGDNTITVVGVPLWRGKTSGKKRENQDARAVAGGDYDSGYRRESGDPGPDASNIF